VADLCRKYRTILKVAPASTKQQDFDNQLSRFTAWQLLFHERNARHSLSSPASGMVNNDALH
jgi:hypothetical protein